VAIDPRAHLGEVVEVVGRARHQLLAGLADGLAGVAGFDGRDLGDVPGDQFAELVHHPGALGRRRCGPLRERGLGCRHRSMDLGLATGCHLGQHLLVGGIHGLEVLAAFDELTVDQVGNAHLRALR
jgi:hypothetical protein